jgi:glycosyltransferase involved in cell wall biosynthesis
MALTPPVEDCMRIAQVTTLAESVPPRAYGGTERVVSYLTEALVGLGHEVALYASADSVTSAELRACCARSLRSAPTSADPIAIHEIMMRRVLAESADFDIIHFHTGWFEFPLFAGKGIPCLSTMHGPMGRQDIQERVRRFRSLPLVSISHAQRAPIADANWIGTIYHGLPNALAVADKRERDYLAFLGRISPEKRPDLAIEIAWRAGFPLKLVAKVDAADKAYFDAVIRPLLAAPDIEFIGELGEADKMRFLAGARALVFPIDWAEPFGLVMIEAMACGTPVIAFRKGSVPEVVDHGITGFIVDDVKGAVDAVMEVGRLDRERIRENFRRRFSSLRMANDYIVLYKSMIARRRQPHIAGSTGFWDSGAGHGAIPTRAENEIL